MSIGFSKQNLVNKLRGKKLPGNIAEKAIQAAGGQGKRPDEGKQRIVDFLAHKSEWERLKKLSKIGLTYEEKKRLEKIIAGDEKMAQLNQKKQREEEQRKNILAKRNKARARYDKNMESQGGGVADKLIKEKSGGGLSRRARRVNKTVERVMTKDGRKVSFSDIGIEGRKYKQFAAADDYVEEGSGLKQGVSKNSVSISRKSNVVDIAKYKKSQENLTGNFGPSGRSSPSNRQSNIPLATGANR
ncbi:MAG: hypothetical protein U9R06_04040 [Patescibacteria group bacterium]|nr:hypothetical protein [Patescibacteria group bacterium]